MKKLIAISVVFALVAGAVFAADIGVDVKGGINVIKGDTGKDSGVNKDNKPTTVSHKVTADGGISQFRISASGEDDNGTFGGFFRWDAKPDYDNGWGNAWNGNIESAQGHVWWKPIDQLKVLIGGGPDGRFGADGNARWNFYQVAGDVGIPKENWKLSPSFYGGWDPAGLDLIITPIEALEINLAIPFISNAGNEVGDIFLKSALQFAYTADGLGKFALTYQSGLGNKAPVDPTIWKDGKPVDGKGAIADPGTLWLYAGLNMIENLALDIGFGYTLPKSGKAGAYVRPAITNQWASWFGDNDEIPGWMAGVLGDPSFEGKTLQELFTAEGTTNSPIAFGLAAKYDAGDFGIKARTQVLFLGKVQYAGASDPYNIPLNLIFDVLPYYAINEALTFHFSAGVDYTAKNSTKGYEDADDNYALIGFHVTPYVSIKSSWWAPNFYAGIDVRTNGSKVNYDGPEKDGSSVINWSIPLGIAFSY